jgi:hypothetical protein
MPEQPALKDDMIGSALVALAFERFPRKQARRVAAEALAAIAMPVDTPEDEEYRAIVLATVMGFGPFGQPLGTA